MCGPGGKSPNLISHREFADLYEVYKYMDGTYKTEAGELFEFNSTATRCHSLKLQKERFHMEVRKILLYKSGLLGMK